MRKTVYSKDDVEVLEQDTVYKGYFTMQKLALRYRLFAGGWSRVLNREVFKRGVAVAALLYDAGADEVVLLEQFRVGALEDLRSPWLLEVVAGMLEPGEQIIDVAQREIQEETGLTSLAIEPICEYWVSPGCSTERVALFCVKVDASLAQGIHGLAEEGEDIRLQRWPLAKAYDLIGEGIIVNAPTIIALQWLQLHHHSLKAKWS